ncbi:hypothetical protein H4R33_007155, partial [Dimargaris cristalligena]
LNEKRESNTDTQRQFDCTDLNVLASTFRQVIQKKVQDVDLVATSPELLDQYLGWIYDDLKAHLITSANGGDTRTSGAQTNYRAVDWAKVPNDQRAESFPLFWCAAQTPAEVLSYLDYVQWLVNDQGDTLADYWVKQTVGDLSQVLSGSAALQTYIQKVLVERVLLTIIAVGPTARASRAHALQYCLAAQCSLPVMLAGLNDPFVGREVTATLPMGKYLLDMSPESQQEVAECAGVLGYFSTKQILDRLFPISSTSAGTSRSPRFNKQQCGAKLGLSKNEPAPFTNEQQTFRVWLNQGATPWDSVMSWGARIQNRFTGRN